MDLLRLTRSSFAFVKKAALAQSIPPIPRRHYCRDSAYLRFVKENLHKLPSKLAPKEKIKTIAVQWKSLAEEDKARYVSEYEAAKKEKKNLDGFLQNVDEDEECTMNAPVCGVKGANFDRPLPPKTPPSAYVRFVMDKIHQLPSELDPKEKSKTIAVQWENLAEEDKARYVTVSECEAADEDKIREIAMQWISEEDKKSKPKKKPNVSGYTLHVGENVKNIYDAMWPDDCTSQLTPMTQKRVRTMNVLATLWRNLDPSKKASLEAKAKTINEERKAARGEACPFCKGTGKV